VSGGRQRRLSTLNAPAGQPRIITLLSLDWHDVPMVVASRHAPRRPGVMDDRP
jgi:hypothetical protein